MNTFLFALTRALHFASCLLLPGTFTFDRFLLAPLIHLQPAIEPLWYPIRRRLLLINLPLSLLTGLLWFLCVAASISDTPLTLTSLPLHSLLTQTTFGTASKIRLALWLLTTLLALLSLVRSFPKPLRALLSYFSLTASAALLTSLTWTGHGIHGPAGHRIADFLHLLAAGFWPAGLLPLLLVLAASRTLPEPAPFRHALALRFSTMSLIAVSALACTGLINGLVLVGSPANLFTSSYGLWLAAKLLLFAAMILLGARNLLCWSSRLSPGICGSSPAATSAEIAAHKLQSNVTLELTLGSLILLVVGILGLLPHPAN